MGFDKDRYELHLAAARAERGLNLSRLNPPSGPLIKFDPKKHPRDYLGKFREVLGDMKPGDTVEVKSTPTDEGGAVRVNYGREMLPNGETTDRNIYWVSEEAPLTQGATNTVTKDHKSYATPGGAAKAAMTRSGRAGGRGNLPDALDFDKKSFDPALIDTGITKELSSQLKDMEQGDALRIGSGDMWERNPGWGTIEIRRVDGGYQVGQLLAKGEFEPFGSGSFGKKRYRDADSAALDALKYSLARHDGNSSVGGRSRDGRDIESKSAEWVDRFHSDFGQAGKKKRAAARSRKDAWDAWNAPYEGPDGLKASDEDAALSVLKTLMPKKYADAGIEAVRTPAMSEALDEIYEMNSGTGISRKNIQQVVDILTKAAKKK